ncbi:hypothetical protein C7445_101207 [Alicyclobacillus sacchari]|uniref:Uncharacterized protein n=1 Tax=Alicyclobacillus sacchari TaxID=392010 RepID=A0A4R8LWM5_9BACL|nr:hypothetical protein [Alicyclobacillus sacchari]TDY51207.1 hypothetical protein C7445_101207 [Alicyclobacillus sacchari]GMA56474.1 hypothetical protein GCM10025858_09770 [Alicyclobacillus sacchari]
MAWPLSLDIVELASVLSSAGTLAIAVTSWYQIHRANQETFYPIVAIDDIAQTASGVWEIAMKNYGTGPALELKLTIQSDGGFTAIPPIVSGTRVTGLHLAPNEQKVVQISMDEDHKARRMEHQHGERRALSVSYRCIRGRKHELLAELPEEFEQT